jgi:micrococcal nuclease
MKPLFLFILTMFTFVSFGNTTRVTRIIDGDTFETETGEKIRLIGINAPEVSDIFGKESRQHLKNLIENKTVELKKDNISSDRDNYNRLLRYIFLDGIDVNEKMILDGYAFAYLKFGFEKLEKYKIAQIDASQNNKGIWGLGNKVKNTNNTLLTKSLYLSFSVKEYILLALLSILILIGFYYYFKR